MSTSQHEQTLGEEHPAFKHDTVGLGVLRANLAIVGDNHGVLIGRDAFPNREPTSPKAECSFFIEEFTPPMKKTRVQRN